MARQLSGFYGEQLNLSALIGNFARARRLCSSRFDQVKYLLWLYGHALPAKKGTGAVELNFRLAAPVAEVSLHVRANGGADAFIFSEVFEHLYYDFALSSPPSTVLDLGANIGLTTLFFSRKYPQARIACVEPIPGNVALLRTNLERNGVSAEVVAKAISVEDTPLMMCIADNDYGHKVADIPYGRTMIGETIRVEGISVATLLATLGWQRIGLLKIDLEGYEGVLLGERCQWLERVDAICIECHEGYGIDDLRALSEKFGFSQPQALAGTVLMVRDSTRLYPI